MRMCGVYVVLRRAEVVVWAFGRGGKKGGTVCLEAFTVDDGGAGLIVFLLADPHLLEG